MANKFPLELSSFKKVKEDGKYATLKHPDGHEIKISKAVLDERRKKQLSTLQNYAEGGEVEEEEPFDPGRSPAGGWFSDAVQSADRWAQEHLPSFGRGALSPNEEGKINIPLPSAEQLGRGLVKSPISQAPETAAPGPAPASVPPPQQATQIAPQQPAQQQAPQGIKQAPAPASEGQQYRQAVMGEAAGRSALDKQQAAIEQQGIEQMQQAQQMYQKNYQGLVQEHQNLVSDYEKGHIDPDRYMKDKSTVGRVSSAIGLLLGGMGGGLLKQENPALKYLNDNINRDIDAQKEELGKKKNLLSHNMQMFGNMNDAVKMTEANLAGITAAKIRKAALQSSDPIRRNAGIQEALKFEMQYAPKAQIVAANQTAQALLRDNKGLSAEVINSFPEDIRERVVQIPGGPTLLSPSKEGAKKAAASIQTFNGINRQIEDMKQFMDKTGTTFPGTEASARADSMKSQLSTTLKELYQLGALSGGDLDLLNAQIPNPGQFSQGKGKAKLETLSKLIEGKYADAISTHLPGNKVAPLGGERAPEIKTMGGVRYQKAPGGWQKVK